MTAKRTIIGMVLIAVLVLQIGCTAQENPQDLEGTEDTGKTVMEEFSQLIDNGAELSAVIDFIDGNIDQVSAGNASLMLDQLEKAQKENQPLLDAKFYSDESIQVKLMELYGPQLGFELADAEQVEHEEVRALLLETRDTGYKVETAEGMFFPIIDYQFYQQYSSYVTADMQEYMEIMATESASVPAKDAALVIGWDEVLARALRQEKFIRLYPDSIKIEQVKELYAKYVSFTLFGLNNTPLFSYDSNTMVDEAQTAYLKAAGSNEDGGYIQLVREYLQVLEENNYRLTEAVDQYRKNAYESI
ncbi:MAG: hypothetical protein ACOX3A_01930 [bacterium]